MPRRRSTQGDWITLLPAFVLLWCTGVYLRTPILMAPPLAPLIADDMNLGSVGIGALTTIPILLLSVAALAGAFMITIVGARRAVACGLLIVAAASAGRGLTLEAWQLFLLTGVMGFGIAVVQPALPALLTIWCPRRIALGTTVYMNGMLVGEVVGAGLTIPVFLPMAGGDWRLALVLVSMPAALVAFAVFGRVRGEGVAAGPVPRWMPVWNSFRVWRLGLLLGATGSLFFGVNAYMATILAGRGDQDLLAPGLLLFNTGQVIASLLAFRYAPRWLGRSGPVLIMLCGALAALILFASLSGIPALMAAFLVSFTSATILILLVSLPPVIAERDSPAALAAGMFTIGYAFSFLVPMLGGVLVDLTGRPLASLLPPFIAAVAAIPLAAGIGSLKRAQGAQQGPPGNDS